MAQNDKARDNDAPASADVALQAQIASQIGTAIAAAMREQNQAFLATQPTPTVKIGDFKSRMFNPTGKPRPEQFDRDYYQNGDPLSTKRVLDEEFALLPKVKPGLYVNGRVRVAEFDKGGRKAIHIDYPVKRVEDRMENKNYWRNFADLLKLIVNDTPATAS